jgi:uncharacterized protein
MTRIAEDDVLNYLFQNPKFFHRHIDLLATMDIPRANTENLAITERELGVLRAENRQLQAQLKELINIAKQNESLNRRIQQLIIKLTQTQTLEEFFTALYDLLQAEFGTDAIIVRIFANSPSQDRPEFVEYDAQVFQLFEDILSSQDTVCGRIKPEHKNYLFPQSEINSAVLIPLGGIQGILVLGSKDVARFNAEMSTDLLKYMGELIGQLLRLWARY